MSLRNCKFRATRASIGNAFDYDTGAFTDAGTDAVYDGSGVAIDSAEKLQRLREGDKKLEVDVIIYAAKAAVKLLKQGDLVEIYEGPIIGFFELTGIQALGWQLFGASRKNERGTDQ